MRIRNATLAFASCVALLVPVLASADSAGSPPGSTNLILINGWKNSPDGSAKASVSTIHGIVHFKGAIWTKGNSPVPFVLPAPFRPAAIVFVPIDMCAATNGRLIIATDGTVSVQAESDFRNAQCLTSLDGASFALSSDGFKPITLINGWTAYGIGTASPAARVIGGVVHFEGAIDNGTTAVPFVLPAALRPAFTIYTKVDLADAADGRLKIGQDGTVTVQTDGSASEFHDFTSLDGASYALNSSGFSALVLINGWTEYGNGSANAAVKLTNGVVQFEGAIATSGTDAVPFVLPAAFRPAKEVFVPVDMCDATNGRLDIDPSGTVTVQAEGDFSTAQCFTSLDGVSFHL
jgi:hypothetical protein